MLQKGKTATAIALAVGAALGMGWLSSAEANEDASSAGVTSDAGLVSVYTTLAVNESCVIMSEYDLGASFSCPGLGGFGVHYDEGDLRASVFFGHLGPWYAEGAWESFSSFNTTGDTIEWRLDDGVPFATILRWFIDHDGGNPEARGQVLVVSKVGEPGVGAACIVGYVDALTNADANEIARSVADTMARDFTCMVDEPIYHGEEGILSGTPVRTFGP